MTISREVIKNTVVDVSYIGNHASQVWRALDWNFVVPSAPSRSSPGNSSERSECQ